MRPNPGGLGAFIRSRRDRTSPEAVGLPAGGRRRAPGLRRSELAALADISVEYLVRIEQGRDRNPSPQVLDSIGTALRLSPEELERLHDVAKTSSGQCILTRTTPGTEVRDGVRALLESFEPGVGAVTNRVGDLLVWTSTFELVAGPMGLLDGPEPNLTRYVFTDPRARTVFPEWERIADERAFDLCLGPTADRAQRMVEELTATAGAPFTDRLDPHDLPHARTQLWRHPEVDLLRFDVESLELSASDNQQLLLLLPGDEATAAALDDLRLRASGGLRSVG